MPLHMLTVRKRVENFNFPLGSDKATDCAPVLSVFDQLVHVLSYHCNQKDLERRNDITGIRGGEEKYEK